MSGIYDSQSSTGFRGMSVPETIQWSTDPSASTSGQPISSQYRPMQVPDRITLNEASPAVVSPSSNEGAGQERPYHNPEPLTSDVKTKEITSTQAGFLPIIPQDFGPPANNIIDNDLAQKLMSLDNRISRLESRVSRFGSGAGSSGPSRFWYVVTFSAWMMLPLTVVFMFYYRRHS